MQLNKICILHFKFMNRNLYTWLSSLFHYLVLFCIFLLLIAFPEKNEWSYKIAWVDQIKLFYKILLVFIFLCYSLKESNIITVNILLLA